jgi:hypothetical protein
VLAVRVESSDARQGATGRFSLRALDTHHLPNARFGAPERHKRERGWMAILAHVGSAATLARATYR